MRKRILTILLACALVAQSGGYVLAEGLDTEITQNDRGGGYF